MFILEGTDCPFLAKADIKASKSILMKSIPDNHSDSSCIYSKKNLDP